MSRPFFRLRTIRCSPDASINRFFICNTWHHVQNRPQYMALMKKMLKPGGQIIVVDYKKEAIARRPAARNENGHERGHR